MTTTATTTTTKVLIVYGQTELMKQVERGFPAGDIEHILQRTPLYSPGVSHCLACFSGSGLQIRHISPSGWKWSDVNINFIETWRMLCPLESNIHTHLSRSVFPDRFSFHYYLPSACVQTVKNGSNKLPITMPYNPKPRGWLTLKSVYWVVRSFRTKPCLLLKPNQKLFKHIASSAIYGNKCSLPPTNLANKLRFLHFHQQLSYTPSGIKHTQEAQLQHHITSLISISAHCIMGWSFQSSVLCGSTIIHLVRFADASQSSSLHTPPSTGHKTWRFMISIKHPILSHRFRAHLRPL